MARYELKIFLKNKWIKISLIFNLIILITTLIFIFINIKPDPERSYIIYYTSLEGIKMVGYFWNFYLLWFIGFFFSILHFSLAIYLWIRNKKLSQFILASNILLNIFLSLAIFALVTINF
ncbi:MAG TPA: hypothetical protein PK168_02125 [Candidatus Paceibacterota bacterium]|jgi:hypothetical protein|nr:hypothetical protein [Parcubacteria group bacterium]HOM33367.1 hypothetical protein [Candidatus Paceibacterota bacterium]